MHDCKGRPLNVGDMVLVPFVVTSTYANDEYCNASLLSVAAMFPGDAKTNLTVNTKQTIRANEGDETGFEVFSEGAATRIR